ncbi:MAG: HypC/HybG/HupF family hydrogenase formation chaperone [Nanoarchaeota archaeon]|nr:HypC/HybG/HupF family hydrogenase formation chaperone [Nanoarchaeota archaeon]
MCLAIPGKIEKIEGEEALIDYDGIKKKANISFIDAKVGDYVLVHVGFAIETIDEKKAKEMYSLLAEEEEEEKIEEENPQKNE